LGEEVISEAIDVPSGPAVACAVDEAVGIGYFRFDERLANRKSRRRVKVGRRLKGDRDSTRRVMESDFGGVEKHTSGGCAAVERVTENGKPVFGCVNADLMCFAGEGLGASEVGKGTLAMDSKAGLGNGSAWMDGAADIFLSSSDEAGFDREIRFLRGAVSEKEIGLSNCAVGELFGQ